MGENSAKRAQTDNERRKMKLAFGSIKTGLNSVLGVFAEKNGGETGAFAGPLFHWVLLVVVHRWFIFSLKSASSIGVIFTSIDSTSSQKRSQRFSIFHLMSFIRSV